MKKRTKEYIEERSQNIITMLSLKASKDEVERIKSEMLLKLIEEHKAAYKAISNENKYHSTKLTRAIQISALLFASIFSIAIYILDTKNQTRFEVSEHVNSFLEGRLRLSERKIELLEKQIVNEPSHKIKKH